MGLIYQFHGLTIDCIDLHQPNSDAEDKHIKQTLLTVPTTNLVLTTLRDNMVTSPNELVQGELNFAIVDEVDSVLIDDARTPLIISGLSKRRQTEFDFKTICR